MGATAWRQMIKPASIPRMLASPRSFPLDRAGRLGRIVVDHPVDALDLVDDAGGGAAEEVVAERVDVGGHAIDAGHGAKRADIIVSPRVTHHAHGADGEQHGESLPNGIVK